MANNVTVKTHITYEGQNIIDLALQLYGDPLAFFILLDDNPHLSLEEIIPAGTEIAYDEAKIDIKKRPLVEYFKNRLPNPVIIKSGSEWPRLKD